MFFDPLYLLFMAPALILAGWAQMRVKSAYAEASQISARSRLTGYDAAVRIIQSHGLRGVGVEASRGGTMSDHYDPRAKMLRLSPDVYQGRSLAALGIAAHEAGHAIQDAKKYAPLTIRNAIVPLASFGSNAAWLFLIIGFMMNSMGLVFFGIAAFSAVVVFQLINLPVEYDASSRAKAILFESGMVAPDEQAVVNKVLGAAALTYVAATLTSILTLLYFLMRSGLLSRR